MIGHYDNFNTRGFPGKLIFDNFNNQPILSYYYNLLNDDDGNDNNITGNTVDNTLPENEGVEYAVSASDEDINNGIIIDDDDRLASSI